jgi:hypothetical protein
MESDENRATVGGHEKILSTRWEQDRIDSSQGTRHCMQGFEVKGWKVTLTDCEN